MCRGWKSPISLGRTSQPQVSVAMAAMSCACSHGAVCSERPGAEPPL